MPIHLADIAEIRTGYTFREALTSQDDGDLRILQIKDIQSGQPIQTDQLLKINGALISDTHHLRRHDIVIVARGIRNNAAIFEGDGAVVAASQFLILTLRDAQVLPHYLLWYLAYAEQVQKFLAERKAGSAMPILNKTTLSELPVIIPTVEQQQRIVAMQQLADREQQIYQDLQRTRQQQLRAVFSQLLEQAT